MEKVYVAKEPHDKAMQRALLNFWIPEKKALVIDALRKAGRTDLIGTGAECLVYDPKFRKQPQNQQNRNKPSDKESSYANKKKHRR